MSDAERQRKRREKLKQESMTAIYVKGEGGEFDARIRVALAVKELANEKLLNNEVIEKIIERSELVIPTKDFLTRKYIRKIVSKYLNNN